MDFLFLFDDLTVDGFSLLMFSGESCQKELIVLVTDTWSSNVLTVEQFGDDNCSFLALLDDRWLVGLFVNDSWSIDILTGEQFRVDSWSGLALLDDTWLVGLFVNGSLSTGDLLEYEQELTKSMISRSESYSPSSIGIDWSSARIRPWLKLWCPSSRFELWCSSPKLFDCWPLSWTLDLWPRFEILPSERLFEAGRTNLWK